MDEERKRKMIQIYFEDFPIWGLILAFLGFLVLIFFPQGFIIWLPFLAIGGYLTWQYYQDLPTDEQVDKWLEEDVKSIETMALSKLGTLEEATIKESLTLYKPIWWQVKNIPTTEIKKKLGKDQMARFSIWAFNINHLTEKYLGSYWIVWNFLKGKSAEESTDEFFYKDIVRVGTYKESQTLLDGSKVDIPSFVLKVSSGDAIIVQDITQWLAEKNVKTIQTPSIEKHLQAIRTMLRDKKD